MLHTENNSPTLPNADESVYMRIAGKQSRVLSGFWINHFYTFNNVSDSWKNDSSSIMLLQDSSYEVKIIIKPMVIEMDARKGWSNAGM